MAIDPDFVFAFLDRKDRSRSGCTPLQCLRGWQRHCARAGAACRYTARGGNRSSSPSSLRCHPSLFVAISFGIICHRSGARDRKRCARAGIGRCWGERRQRGALLSARRNATGVTFADFEAAIDRVVGGLEQRSRVMNPTERKTSPFTNPVRRSSQASFRAATR